VVLADTRGILHTAAQNGKQADCPFACQTRLLGGGGGTRVPQRDKLGDGACEGGVLAHRQLSHLCCRVSSLVMSLQWYDDVGSEKV
jgi:hypothetical protein